MLREQCEKLPFWSHLTVDERQYVLEHAIFHLVSANEIITSSDTECMGMVYIIEGEIRVSILSEEGREITLFRVEKGDSCVTTASCVIKQITFNTMTTAITDTSMLVIPASVFAKLCNDNIYVKAYMYEKETERFSSAMWVMQQILFKKFDVRLAEYLLTESSKNGDSVIRQTQEEIARNVNSAREVVARMLRQFANDSWISVRRGSIVIEKKDKLEELIR